MKKEKDKCVCCKKESPYDKGENIINRFHYVEGSGQLCKTCWDEIYGCSMPRHLEQSV